MLRGRKTNNQRISSTLVITISFLVDLLDIILSLAVAILSGSVIMLTQVMEGVSDLISSGLLLVGLARSSQKEDREHPFGYGREIYFWALLSGIVMFSITATLSIYFGWKRFINPEHIQNINLAFLILGITTITNGFAFYLSLKRILRNRNLKQLLGIFLRSSLVETKTTFILDLMGVSASILGIIALLFYKFTGDFRFDGLGAILIGATLLIFAYLLLIGIVDLIIGRSVSLEVEERIRLVALNTPQVQKILGLKTLHIGSEKLLVNMEVHLAHNLETTEIEKLIHKIKTDIRKEIPEVKHIQVELETPYVQKSFPKPGSPNVY